MSKIKVNTDLMKVTERELEEQIKKLKKSVNKMYELINGTNSIWEGDKHDGYVKIFEEHKKQLNNIISGFQKYDAAFEKAINKYETCSGKMNDQVNRVL